MKHVHRNIKQLMDLLDKSKDDKRALGKREGQVLANTYYTDKIPDTGEFIGRLDYKAWGVGSSLRLFITLVNGHRVTCSVFRSNTQVRWYGPRDDSYDFSQTGIEGRFFDLHLVLSKKGFINIRSASESSETFDNLPPPPAAVNGKSSEEEFSLVSPGLEPCQTILCAESSTVLSKHLYNDPLEGSVDATLEYRAWGRGSYSDYLSLFFTDNKSKRKFRVFAFEQQSDGSIPYFGCDDRKYNFLAEGIEGLSFKLDLHIKDDRYITLKHAEPSCSSSTFHKASPGQLDALNIGYLLGSNDLAHETLLFFYFPSSKKYLRICARGDLGDLHFGACYAFELDKLADTQKIDRLLLVNDRYRNSHVRSQKVLPRNSYHSKERQQVVLDKVDRYLKTCEENRMVFSDLAAKFERQRPHSGAYYLYIVTLKSPSRSFLAVSNNPFKKLEHIAERGLDLIDLDHSYISEIHGSTSIGRTSVTQLADVGLIDDANSVTRAIEDNEEYWPYNSTIKNSKWFMSRDLNEVLARFQKDDISFLPLLSLPSSRE